MSRVLILTAMFLSAFLLFIVQPLYAKYLLPFFGGTSSVWTISVFFYSTTLLVGYLYASLLTHWKSRIARLIHTSLLVLAGALLLSRWATTDSPLLVEAVESSSPAISVLLTLALGVGLPVLLLASTSVIAQHLYARLTDKEPYSLYALSNVGSLLGLAAYPFLVEPFTALPLQSAWWAILFILFLLLLMGGWRQVDKVTAEKREQGPIIDMALKHRWKIVLMAAIPTFLLASVTELLSQGIASFPLLWIIPLMLYLVSFILAFSDRSSPTPRIPFSFWVLLLMAPAIALFPYINIHPIAYWLSFVMITLSFFFICVYFHRRIYSMRPRVQDLGPFYVWLTLGGALGSGTVGMILPLVLNSQLEVYFAFGTLALYLAYQLLKRIRGTLPTFLYRTFLGLGGAIVFLVVLTTVVRTGDVANERNFYGTLKVVDMNRTVYDESVPVRTILNGVTAHGLQALDERYYSEATSYYGPDSGIDFAIRSFTEASLQPRVAVVGLGAGMMNAYCDDVTSISYIEINPIVEDIAREYFTYLDFCAEKTEVQIGDGRLVLEGEVAAGKKEYDVIMMDAFTDDAIPSHLLTVEAFKRAYGPLLSERGVIAFHISNRYLNLFPPIVGTARANGYEAVAVFNEPSESNELYLPTIWVLVTKPENVDRLKAFPNVVEYEGREIVWTDNQNSVMSVLTLGSLFDQ